MKMTRTFIKFVLWLRCVWLVSVYLPTAATGVLSHCAEGQMSQNASQRDRLVTPVDLQPHGALSADKIQHIRRLLVPNTIWRAPMEVKDTFSLRMLSHFEAKYLQWAHDENTWQSKKKSNCLWKFHYYKAIKVAYRVVDPCMFEDKYGCKNTLSWLNTYQNHLIITSFNSIGLADHIFMMRKISSECAYTVKFITHLKYSTAAEVSQCSPARLERNNITVTQFWFTLQKQVEK